MFLESYDAIIKHMVKQTPQGGYYVPELVLSAMRSKTIMEHLACFSGAMFALGSTYRYVP